MINILLILLLLVLVFLNINVRETFTSTDLNNYVNEINNNIKELKKLFAKNQQHIDSINKNKDRKLEHAKKNTDVTFSDRDKVYSLISLGGLI